MYLDIPSSYTDDNVGAKSVVMKKLGNEMMQEAVTVTELADSTQLSPYVRLN
jgi:hypothetical protein